MYGLNTGPLTDTYFGVCDFNHQEVRDEELCGAQTVLCVAGGTWGWRSRTRLSLPRSSPRLGGHQAEKCPARSGMNEGRAQRPGRRRWKEGRGPWGGEMSQGATRRRPHLSPVPASLPASLHTESPRTLSRCALQTRDL